MTEYKIYKIKSSLTDTIYIGSTSKTLEKRLSIHKSKYKAWLKDNTKYYITSFEILKFNDYVIELIETCLYIDKLERNDKEGHFIKLNKLICVNKKIETRTMKEYKEDNKEEIKQYQNEYRNTHSEKMKQYQNEYRYIHIEEIKARDNKKHVCSICNSIYTHVNKTRHEKTNKHLEKLNQSKYDITITYDKEIGHIKQLS